MRNGNRIHDPSLRDFLTWTSMRNRPGTASPVKGTLQQHLTLLPAALLLAVPMLQQPTVCSHAEG
jgi:hypothetical protein